MVWKGDYSYFIPMKIFIIIIVVLFSLFFQYISGVKLYFAFTLPYMFKKGCPVRVFTVLSKMSRVSSVSVCWVLQLYLLRYLLFYQWFGIYEHSCFAFAVTCGLVWRGRFLGYFLLYHFIICVMYSMQMQLIFLSVSLEYHVGGGSW